MVTRTTENAPAAQARDVELARDSYAAGFRGADLVRAVAIQLIESGGQDNGPANDVLNPPPGLAPEHSVGRWQINILAHGNKISEARARTGEGANAYAFGLYQAAGNSFAADWTQADAALNGSGSPEALQRAQDAQQRATAAVATLGVQAAQGTPQATQGSTQRTGLDIAGAGEFFGKAGDAITAVTAKGFWPRITLTAIAFVLVGGGIVLYFREPIAHAVERAADTGAQTTKTGAGAAAA